MIHKVASHEPDDSAHGRTLAVTPEIAGWADLTFRTYLFRAGHQLDGESAGDEVLAVFLRGSATMRVGDHMWEVDGRSDPLSGPPICVYMPPRHAYLLTPHTDCEVAYARAPAEGRFPPRLIAPGKQAVAALGEGNTRHDVVSVLGPGDAEHLLCAEVLTPPGNWADCLLHQRGTASPAHGLAMAEVCYHRTGMVGGWAVQRLYTDDGVLDEALVVRDAEAVLIGLAHHPAVAAPDCALYSLHVAIAG